MEEGDPIVFLVSALSFAFYAPTIFSEGGHIVSLLPVHTSICKSRPYIRKMVSVCYLLKILVYLIHILYTGIYS